MNPNMRSLFLALSAGALSCSCATVLAITDLWSWGDDSSDGGAEESSLPDAELSENTDAELLNADLQPTEELHGGGCPGASEGEWSITVSILETDDPCDLSWPRRSTARFTLLAHEKGLCVYVIDSQAIDTSSSGVPSLEALMFSDEIGIVGAYYDPRNDSTVSLTFAPRLDRSFYSEQGFLVEEDFDAYRGNVVTSTHEGDDLSACGIAPGAIELCHGRLRIEGTR